MRFLFFCLFASHALADDFSNPPNTEHSQTAPLPAAAAAAAIKLPPGFHATAFAAEPDVQQPIAMAIDARGRLWVAECYTYGEGKVNFDTRLRDRILIFEDLDNDGHFDNRKVFWDEGKRLTSIELGFGGVWATCAPDLIFIPDRNGDDRPDGPPERLLDGFDAGRVRHNIVNGLRWGPDGWLYGRHGIQNYSFVGRPGAPAGEAGVRAGQRTKLSCCIWRFHPTRRTFEVVAEGTTNPWGLDWNEAGEGFFTNTVIGHLWHLIPGGHYRRMYGEDLNPHVYQLMEQCADHFHWDTGENWTKSRAGESGRVAQKNDVLGGGHAHCGCLIYQGEMFPAPWRGKLLTLNFHGRRINVDRLEPHGSGYVGKHESDFAQFPDPWFRGIDLIQAPDGGIYVSDWSDAGECHEEDGVHRSSGRIFKISYDPAAQNTAHATPGENQAAGVSPPSLTLPRDVAALGDAALVSLQLSRNAWLARTARRVLQERATAGALEKETIPSLWKLLDGNADTGVQTHLLGSLQSIGALDETKLSSLLDDKSAGARAWATHALAETVPSNEANRHLVRRARDEDDPVIWLHMASLAARLPHDARGEIVSALLTHDASNDQNVPLMLWYAMEPLLARGNAEAFARRLKITDVSVPLLRRHIVRRLAEQIDDESCRSIIARFIEETSAAKRKEIVPDLTSGLAQGLMGRRKAPKPSSWQLLITEAKTIHDSDVANTVRALSALFGDGRALDEIRAVALDGNATYATRRAALQTLVDSRDPELRKICENTLGIRELTTTAARGLATFDEPAVAEMLVKQYGSLWTDDRLDLITVLVSRPGFARRLLAAVGDGRIPRSDISAFHARQILSLNDVNLAKALRDVWGEIRATDEARRATISKLEKELRPDRLSQSDPRTGRLLFNRTCAACHRLFGEGGDIGPDLTGADRANLNYLLENIVDPNAIVPVDARMSIVTLKDGRVLTGIVGNKSERTVTVRALAADVRTFERAEIAKIEESPQSMMPEHLLETLKDDEVRDLIAYLMSKEQVPLQDASGL